MKTTSLLSVVFLSALTTFSVQGQTTRVYTNNSGTGDGEWLTQTNWTDGDAADTNTEAAQLNGSLNLGVAGVTVARVQNFFASNAPVTVSGPGTLTIDINGVSADGIRNVAGATNAGSLVFDNNVIINNSGGATNATVINFTNGTNTSRSVTFNGNLTLNSRLKTVNGTGGTVNFNGVLGASSQLLQIESSRTVFGSGHDSSAFGQDVVLFTGGVLSVEGGTVLNNGRKFQINGSSEIQLNAANAINNANFVVGATNTLTLAANTDQNNLGFLNIENGGLLLNLDAGVNNLFFEDTSSIAWGTGTVNITGFREGVIKFGSDANGLTSSQLSAIDGGIYSLSSEGFLTAIPEPGTITLMLLFSAGLLIFRRR